MKLVSIAVVVLFASTAAAQTGGDAAAGKALWESGQTQCRFCHGGKGEGSYGPDLAGRKLTIPQFTRALRTPWGVMPAYDESVISASDVANVVAYFESLPATATPGAWRFPVPAGAPHGLQLMMATAGCGQCHGAAFAFPRMDMGAMGPDADFDWFKRIVYDHRASMPAQFKLLNEPPEPRLRMGNYSRVRLPESVLREIWTYIESLGRRPKIEAELSAGVSGSDGVTYTLTVHNGGLAGKGLAAEDLTILLALPAGASVVATTGAGSQVTRQDEQLKAMAAVWHLPRLAATEHQTYTITLSRATPAADNLRGTIRWTRPATKIGPVDSMNIAPAPTTAATR